MGRIGPTSLRPIEIVLFPKALAAKSLSVRAAKPATWIFLSTWKKEGPVKLKSASCSFTSYLANKISKANNSERRADRS
jgi:hypothetical protein